MIKDLINSFNNNEGGFSARKLTAFTFVCMAIYVHIRELTKENAVEFLLIDGCLALLCLGIVTAEQIIKFKNGGKEPDDN